MADYKKKRNPKLVPIPPEEPIGGTDVEWPTIEGYPDELQPESFYQYMRANDPYSLYHAQLMEWVKMKIAEAGADTWEKKQIEMLKYKDMLAEAELGIDLLYPVEALPKFDEVRNMAGHGVQMLYESYGTQQLMVIDVARKKREAARTEIFARTEGFDPDLETALANETLSAQEAKLVQESRAKAELLNPANLAGAGGRMKLLRAVQQGHISQEEAYGPGSAWEQWQHEQAKAANATASERMPERTGMVKVPGGYKSLTRQTTPAIETNPLTVRMWERNQVRGSVVLRR
jgi:hypothetical protein